MITHSLFSLFLFLSLICSSLGKASISSQSEDKIPFPLQTKVESEAKQKKRYQFAIMQRGYRKGFLCSNCSFVYAYLPKSCERCGSSSFVKCKVDGTWRIK